MQEIDRNNFRDVLALSVSEPQKHFVASNAYSLSQAKAQPECVPLAVCDWEALVGFVMYAMDLDDREYWIYRVMIDQAYQGKGYGRQAMEALLALIQSDPAHHMVYLSYEPENTVAEKLYESLGFRSDGRSIHGETVSRLFY